MPCSVLNCASCATKAVLSCGVSGLWFSSCVISSVRKSACPSELFSALAGSFLKDSASYALPLTLNPLISFIVQSPPALVRGAAHWPSASTRCASVLAASTTCTLIWNEREAEIMSAISSTTFTFG